MFFGFYKFEILKFLILKFYISEIYNIILNSPGVVTLLNVTVVNKHGGNYSSSAFDVEENTSNNFIIGPVGSIFEMLNPDDDIIGYVK